MGHIARPSKWAGRDARPGQAFWPVPQENIKCIGLNREALYLYKDALNLARAGGPCTPAGKQATYSPRLPA